jgi:hypothetical protein
MNGHKLLSRKNASMRMIEAEKRKRLTVEKSASKQVNGADKGEHPMSSKIWNGLAE